MNVSSTAKSQSIASPSMVGIFGRQRIVACICRWAKLSERQTPANQPFKRRMLEGGSGDERIALFSGPGREPGHTNINQTSPAAVISSLASDSSAGGRSAN